MNRVFYYNLLMILALAIVGCGQRDAASMEQSKDRVADVRYGVNTEGYELIYSKIHAGETMGSIMRSFGRTARDIDRVDRASNPIFPLNKLKAGGRYVAFLGRDSLGKQQLSYLAYERDPLNYILFVMLGDSVSVHNGAKPTEMKRQSRVVVVESSIWSALVDQGMPYNLGEELEEIYSGNVDFFGIRRGDRFTLVYDERFVDDTVSVGVVSICGVKFVHRDNPHYAIVYKQGGQGERDEYWDETGASLGKSMLKAPLRYSRISSRYSNSKEEPIYRIYLKDKGVEYAAPTGSAVVAVADGVVTFRGVESREQGNVIKIRHSDGVVTGYHNLRRFMRGIDSGSRVAQGDIIGYVGSSQGEKNPHLDYRAWVDGEPVNPHSITPKSRRMIGAQSRDEYGELSSKMVRLMDSVESVVVKAKL